MQVFGMLFRQQIKFQLFREVEKIEIFIFSHFVRERTESRPRRLLAQVLAKPQYFAAVNRYLSLGPRRKLWSRQKPERQRHYYLIMTSALGTELCETHRYLNRFPMSNRPFAAKPSLDLLFIKLWAVT